MVETSMANRQASAGHQANLLRDLFAGSISSLLSIAYGLSFAALIFSGPLAPYLAYGIAATFIATATGAIVVASRSSVPFMIAGPDGPTAAVTASLAAATIAPLVAQGSGGLLAPVLFVLAVSAGLTGLLLCTLGLARAGEVIRYVPYPVIGGFLGATGWLMVSGAVRVITGVELNLSRVETIPAAPYVWKVAAALVLAAVLYLSLRRSQSPFVLPGLLLAGIGSAYTVMASFGITLADAQSAGWMFSAPERVSLSLPWTEAGFFDLPWGALTPIAGDLLAVMFVTAITVLLNATGIEFFTKREADLERELTTVGSANILSAVLGGYVNCVSLSRTTIAHAAGGRGRLCGLTVGAVAGLILVANPAFVAFVPKFVLGGLLLYLGLNLLTIWLVQSARRLSRLEYLSLLVIALIIIQWGFIAGVLIGIVIGCATFAFSAARVNAIKFRFDGSEYRSTLDRGQDELAILSEHGHEIQGMSLQSYLFFGSANRLYRQVKKLLSGHPECRFLLFDFRLVTGIDSSAMHSFTQIKRGADEAGARLILCNLTPDLVTTFRTHGIATDNVKITSDFDRALEICERAVIRKHLPETQVFRGLRDWLADDLGGSEFADRLIPYLRRLQFKKGDNIAKQGEPADCMHFIMEGRVAIVVSLPNGKTLRVRSLGFHTTIGEMGMISQQVRSATIEAESDSVVYALDLQDYDRITRDDPALGQALLTYIIGVMTDRLNFASKTMGLLRR